MRAVIGWKNVHKTMNWQWNDMLPKHQLLLLFIQAGLFLYYKLRMLIKHLVPVFKTTWVVSTTIRNVVLALPVRGQITVLFIIILQKKCIRAVVLYYKY